MGSVNVLKAAFVSLILALAGRADGSPLLLNYQATVEGVDSTITVIFGIYADSSAATALWAETRQIETSDGRFSVLLGSVAPLTPDLFDSGERYLGLTVDGNALLPRQRIVSVAYALRTLAADDVPGRAIHPASVEITGAAAVWDSAGVLRTPVLSADSLVIGDTPVIDSAGNWVGPSIGQPEDALMLREVVVAARDTARVFFFNTDRWRTFENFDKVMQVTEAGKLDMSFAAQIKSDTSFETRIFLRQAPAGQATGRIGNIAGGAGTSGDEGVTVYNQAVIDTQPGTYRIIVEHRAQTTIEGTIKSARLIIRKYD